MSVVIGDTAAAATAFVAAGTPDRIVADSLPEHVRPVWRLLSPRPGADVWAHALEASADADETTHPVLVIQRAEGSQFVALQRALRDGHQLPDDLTCVALEGDGFRGQRGRSWAAVRGNLHLCRLARLDLAADTVQAALSALPAVASAAALERATQGRVAPGIKWVNDVVVAGRKVGGVISASHVASDRVTHAVFGIGINVAVTPSVERDPRAAPAGSLRDLAGESAPTLAGLLVALDAELTAAIERLRAGAIDAIVTDYRRRSLAVGRRVAVWPVGDAEPRTAPQRVAIVRAIRDDLGLVLDDGSVVTAGRITFVDGAVEDGVGAAS